MRCVQVSFMIKKIVLIGIFTGLAHLLSFYGISFIVRMNADKIFISKIAELESAIVLMLAVMSFGLQQIATRDIAIKEGWRNVLIFTQKSRLSMGLFIAVCGLILYFFTKDNYYLIFILAPLLALNIDYALYGRGRSVEASFLSLIKVGIPAIVLLILGYLKVFNFNIYFTSVVVAWFIIGFFSNRILKTPLFLKPILEFLKVYFQNMKIGFTDIAITTLKLGVLTLAKPFYTETVLANAFVVLKLYVLVKGIQRVVFQAFYKDLVDRKKAMLIDKIGLIIGFVFFSMTFFYAKEMISFLFSDDYLSSSYLLKLIGLATLISSISISASPRMLLLKQDNGYIKSYFYAFIGTLLFLFIISKTIFFFYGIIGAILFGEIILNSMFFFFLKKDIFSKERFSFIIELGVLFVLLSIISFNFELSHSVMLSALCLLVYGLYFMFNHKNQIL